MTRISLVTTTINVPVLLQDYAKDLVEHGYKEVDIIVTGDNKTSPEARTLCEQVQQKFGIETIYMDVQDQNKFMTNYPALNEFLPFNCIQRRNVAILNAYERGAEMIVTIDDDNFLAQKNYFKSHDIVGVESSIKTLASDNGWLNVCQWLKDENNRKFYHRGYSFEHRAQDGQIKETIAKGRVVVNAGLWLGDPDLDAVTRIGTPINAVEYQRPDNFALAKGTYSPFNSQNTALHRSIIPAYFLCSGIGRYDDIWASYIIKRIADHLGDLIAFGYPLVKQTRNAHILWNDLDQERLGMELTNQFCSVLQASHLTQTNYAACAKELITQLDAFVTKENMSDRHLAFYKQFIKGYECWLKYLAKV